jgi:hypothetical protein
VSAQIKGPITWATVSAIVTLIVAAFTLFPAKESLDLARANVLRALAERDARMDYLQRQIDDLERQVRELGQAQ